MDDELILKFDFKLISKDNEKIQNNKGRYFLSKKYKDFERLIKDTAFVQMHNNKISQFEESDNLNMKIFAYFKTKVHPDLFNLPKSVVDALQGIAYHNDRQIKEGHIIITEAWERDSFSVHINKI
ncbi:RusA family crossover junction endodeoxyribonuclease [Patescibacteria group bacterium]|nr:RusA family crossover junction endodeoxyribonuclease [Patescibacteria group bacterium]